MPVRAHPIDHWLEGAEPDPDRCEVDGGAPNVVALIEVCGDGLVLLELVGLLGHLTAP